MILREGPIFVVSLSVLSEHRENRSMNAKNLSGRDPLSLAEEENLLSEENESANSSHQDTDKVLADVSSAMGQMSSTMLSMENTKKPSAGAPEDHATPPKRRTSCNKQALSNSENSDPVKSDSEKLNFPPNSNPPKLCSSFTGDVLLNEIAQDFESHRNWCISSMSHGVHGGPN